MLSGCNFAVKHDSSKDLTRLQRTGYSNDWLVCPPGTCNEGKEIEIPIFLNNLGQVKYTMLSSRASDIIKVWSLNDCIIPRYF